MSDRRNIELWFTFVTLGQAIIILTIAIMLIISHIVYPKFRPPPGGLIVWKI